MIEAFGGVWAKLPKPLRATLRKSGIPYAVSFWNRYNDRHAPHTFAGTLAKLHEEYPKVPRDAQRALADRFDAALDSLVLPNGVRKTTYARRANAALARFLSEPRWRIATPEVRVLDLPSSSGRASLDCYDLLAQHYNVGQYVLSDVCFEVYYDPDRDCVFDHAGNLLQVRHNANRYISVYQPYTSGHEYGPLARLLLLPHEVLSRLARRSHPYLQAKTLVPLRLVHPEADRRIAEGTFSLKRCDVFALEFREEFDLVLSFNLLQRDYFLPDRIQMGLQNLTNALTEGGYLLTGNSDAFGIAQKRDGKLEMLCQTGAW